MPKINIEIDREGKITIQYIGFQGSACYNEAKRLYDMLKSQGLNVEIKQIIPTTSTSTTTLAEHERI